MNENIQKWDLTTEQGYQTAVDYVGYLFPITRRIFGFLKDFFNTDNSKQAELAERLISTGKEKGARKMVIKLKKSAGLKLNLPEEYKVEASLGKDDEMSIEVTYK